jgi:tight adherence protein C
MDLTGFFVIGFLTVIAGIAFLYLGLRSATGEQLNQRLQDYVVQPASVQNIWAEETIYRRPEVSGSFISRTIVPVFRSIGGLFGRVTPAGSLEDLDRQLTVAGKPLGLGPREFYGLRIIFFLIGLFLAYLIITRGDRSILTLVFAGFSAFFIFYMPKYWLRSAVRRKKDSIRRNLPDALDMLSVSADAGLGFDQSLQRISENWDTPLGNEFGRVVAEMGMGVSRATALRNMTARIDLAELNSFIAVILQSDELGMSIADVLHSQANQMRIERRFWAQEQARKIPLKMLFPLLLLILPALFAVVLGPAIPALMDALGGNF